MRKEYNKLVRDNIPDILVNRGIKFSTHTVRDSDEAKELLLNKINEETTELTEVLSNPNFLPNTAAEEMADIYEALDALTVLLGLDADHIGDIAAKKREHNGAFNKMIVLEWTEENTHSTK